MFLHDATHIISDYYSVLNAHHLSLEAKSGEAKIYTLLLNYLVKSEHKL